MKKIAVAIALALGSFATVGEAIPPEHSWYTSFKLCGSQYYSLRYKNQNGYFAPIKIEDSTFPSSIGGYISSGYQTNKYVAFEMGYNWAGRMPYFASLLRGAYKVQGIQFTGKIDYTVHSLPGMSLYGRLGMLLWRADARQSNEVFTRIKDHDLGAGPVFVFGMEYTINPHWSGNMEYQWSNNLGVYQTLGIRPNNFTFGVSIIHKNKKDTDKSFLDTIVDVLKPSPPIVHKTKYYTLTSNILFDFNEFIIRDKDRQTLDKILRQIHQMSFDKLIINVEGFTDRIGASKFNMELSKKRAQAVVNYLVAQGIPRDKIFIRGMGAAHSTLGNSCNKIKNHKLLVECLAQDRRVELFIEAKKSPLYKPET